MAAMVCVEGIVVDGPYALPIGDKDCLWYNIQVGYRVNENERQKRRKMRRWHTYKQ